MNFVAKINKLKLELFLKNSDDVIACDLWFGPILRQKFVLIVDILSMLEVYLAF